MLKLAVFDLPAVIRYDSELLHHYLVEAVNKVEDSKLDTTELSQLENSTEAIRSIFRDKLNKELSDKKLEKIQKKFVKRIKKYFLEEDESFEIRGGVQSIFGQIEKEKQWKYGILSPYCAEATHLMLQSCGIFSKNKLTITADDATNQEDQLKVAIRRARKKNKKVKALLISGNPKHPSFKGIELVRPHFSKKNPDELSYPRFSAFFKNIL